MNELRVKAVELALAAKHSDQKLDLISQAREILAFITEESSKSDSKPATSAKAKAAKASSASTPAASEVTVAASSTSTASESTASEAVSTPASGTSQESSSPIPSVDDVRAALTARQTRDGGNADEARKVLAKYAKTGTLGSLAEADRAKVIKECNAVS